MKNKESYSVKMLNGLVVKDISPQQLKHGIQTGKYLPSDYIMNSDGGWTHLKDTKHCKSQQKLNGWVVLFILSFIFNIVLVMMLFWQKGRIDQLIN